MKWLRQEGVDFKPYGPNERGTYYTQIFQVRPKKRFGKKKKKKKLKRLARALNQIKSIPHEPTQLSQVLPALEPLYMGWEKNYDSSPVYEWMKSVPWLPVRPSLRDFGLPCMCSVLL